MLTTLYSIRRRALDLLYGMCDVSNAKDIVEELLQVYNHLTVSYIQFFFSMYLDISSME